MAKEIEDSVVSKAFFTTVIWRCFCGMNFCIFNNLNIQDFIGAECKGFLGGNGTA